MTDSTPPTREELIAKYKDLQGQAEALQAKLATQARQGGVKWGRTLLMFGMPVAAGVVIGLVTHSVLFGILGGIGAFVVMIVVAIKMTPPGPGIGSRAWEAKLTAELLVRVIDQRTTEKLQTHAELKRDRLEREIAFLNKQLVENTRIAQSGDPSPGKGYVGFEPYNGD